MSEQTTAAPVAPTVTTTATEGSAAPAATPTVTESTAPQTAREALARIRAGQPVATSPKLAEEVTAALTEQPRGPDGKFVAKPAGDEPAAPQQDTQTQTAAEAVAERVRIALEDGHPLRERGFTELPWDVPKEHEEIARWLAGQPVKKREVAEAHETARQAQALAAEREAEAAFWRENAGTIYTPEFYAKYTDIKNTYGEADAELYKQAVKAKAQEQLAGTIGEQRARSEVTRTARDFRNAAMQDALQRFPGWVVTDQTGEPLLDRNGDLVPAPAMQEAFRSYGALISGTGAQTPNAEDWYSIAVPLYERSPYGQQRRAAEAQRIAEEASRKAQEEAKQREQQALEQAALQRQRNPLGSMPNVQTGLTVPGTTTGPRTAAEFKQQLAARARGY